MNTSTVPGPASPADGERWRWCHGRMSEGAYIYYEGKNTEPHWVDLTDPDISKAKWRLLSKQFPGGKSCPDCENVFNNFRKRKQGRIIGDGGKYGFGKLSEVAVPVQPAYKGPPAGSDLELAMAQTARLKAQGISKLELQDAVECPDCGAEAARILFGQPVHGDSCKTPEGDRRKAGLHELRIQRYLQVKEQQDAASAADREIKNREAVMGL